MSCPQPRTHLPRETLVEVVRHTPLVSIDLICRDGKALVFVEVRQRSRSDFGGAAASITTSKQRRIILAAQHYLAGQPECDCRFDCVLIEGERLEWLKDAFTADA